MDLNQIKAMLPPEARGMFDTIINKAGSMTQADLQNPNALQAMIGQFIDDEDSASGVGGVHQGALATAIGMLEDGIDALSPRGNQAATDLAEMVVIGLRWYKSPFLIRDLLLKYLIGFAQQNPGNRNITGWCLCASEIAKAAIDSAINGPQSQSACNLAAKALMTAQKTLPTISGRVATHSAQEQAANEVRFAAATAVTPPPATPAPAAPPQRPVAAIQAAPPAPPPAPEPPISPLDQEALKAMTPDDPEPVDADSDPATLDGDALPPDLATGVTDVADDAPEDVEEEVVVAPPAKNSKPNKHKSNKPKKQ